MFEATTLDVRSSAGGDGQLVTMVKDGRSLSMSWLSALPVPRLSGSTATYSEVPGVHLQLAAEVEGLPTEKHLGF